MAAGAVIEAVGADIGGAGVAIEGTGAVIEGAGADMGMAIGPITEVILTAEAGAGIGAIDGFERRFH
jgi:hypothetical protein